MANEHYSITAELVNFNKSGMQLPQTLPTRIQASFDPDSWIIGYPPLILVWFVLAISKEINLGTMPGVLVEL